MMHEKFLNCGAYEIIMMLNELHNVVISIYAFLVVFLLQVVPGDG